MVSERRESMASQVVFAWLMPQYSSLAAPETLGLSMRTR